MPLPANEAQARQAADEIAKMTQEQAREFLDLISGRSVFSRLVMGDHAMRYSADDTGRIKVEVVKIK